jgi:phosphoglycolate phosphatase
MDRRGLGGGHGASGRNRRIVIGAGLAETAPSIDWRGFPLPALDDLAGAVIAFDLDGTLVDTAPDLIGVLNYILAEHGHDGLPLEAARTVVGHGARAMLGRGFAAAGETLAPAEMDRLFDHFIALYVGRIAMASRPFPGVIDALDDLEAAGARFAVCTNKRTDLSLALLDALDLTRRFAAVVGPDVAGAYKPDPKHLAFAVEAAGGTLERALMVGDASTDTEAARAARVPVIAVSFGYSDVPAAELGADALIDHFGELPEAARRLLRPQRAAISPILPGRTDA